MRGVRRDMLRELDVLKGRLRRLIHQHRVEVYRSKELLQEAERSIEDQFACLDSLRSVREEMGKRFRKRTSIPAKPALLAAEDLRRPPLAVESNERGNGAKKGRVRGPVESGMNDRAAVASLGAETISDRPKRTLPAAIDR